MLIKFEFIFLGLALLGFTACEKDETNDILYTNLNPDIISTSFLSPDYLESRPPIQYIFNSCLGYYGIINSDTIVGCGKTRIPVDLNKDNIIDFYFIVEHTFSTPGQDYDEFYLLITSPDENSISFSDKDNGYIYKYNSGDSIVATSFHVNYGYLVEGIFLSEPGAFMYAENDRHSYTEVGDFYISVEVKKDSLSYFGWIHVETSFLAIRIKEFAICRIPDKKIKIGQK